MDCIVAAATGALKGINLRDNSFTNLTPIKSLAPKQDEITSMVWSGPQQSDVLAASLDRSLKLYNVQASSFESLYKVAGGEGAVQGLHCLENENVVSCVESGQINIWEKSGESLRRWETGEGVKVMRGSFTHKELLTGGTKHVIKTWDIETGKRLWSARNVPLNSLGLEVPILCTDARYVDESSIIVEATKLHEMRLYDPRAQRRPVKEITFMDAPVTAVSRCYRNNHVLAANSIGEMGLFDLRSKVHPICKYKGQAGAIRSIDAHPIEPYVATCGIDRFVRIHDIDTRKLAHKVYCKTRLNQILIRSELPSVLSATEKDDDQEWTKLKKEMNSYGKSFSENASDDDLLAEECTREKLVLYENQGSLKNCRSKVAQRKRSEDEVDRAELKDYGEEPTTKKRKMEKSRKRKEENIVAQKLRELPKKTKVAHGVKRQEEIEEKPTSDDGLPKRPRKNVAGISSFYC